MRIVLLGPPGSGKTELSERIASTYGLPVITVSSVMQTASAEQSELGVFFHAWFGYEATPDSVQLAAWAGVVVLVLVLWRRQIR